MNKQNMRICLVAQGNIVVVIEGLVNCQLSIAQSDEEKRWKSEIVHTITVCAVLADLTRNPPKSYAIAKLAKERGIMFVAKEIQNIASLRVGRWLPSIRFPSGNP